MTDTKLGMNIEWPLVFFPENEPLQSQGFSIKQRGKEQASFDKDTIDVKAMEEYQGLLIYYK